MPNIPETCELFEADLSALVDGELDTARSAAVRAHLDGCTACSARLQALCDVDLELAGIAVQAAPVDLRARLAARIAEDAAGDRRPGDAPADDLLEDAPANPPSGDISKNVASAVARPVVRGAAPIRRRRWTSAPVLGAAAAAAAALALYLAVGGAERELPLAPLPTQPLVAASDPEPAASPLREVGEQPDARAPAENSQRVAEAVEAAPPTVAAVPFSAGPAGETAESPATDVLGGASDEDLAMLFELETVEDLDLIANLDLLERLVAQEQAVSG